MKRCPECGRDYNDDSLSFCLDDGAELLFGPGSDEPATSILAEAVGVADASEFRTAILHEPATASAVTASRSYDKRFIVAPMVLLIIAIGAFLGYRYFGSNTTQIESIAVMPFLNESGDPEFEYLADGIPEGIINSLSQFPGLKVMSRNSVFQYKAKELNAQSIGNELKVRAVLSGRVLRRGETLSINVELVDALDNSHIWGQQYNRKVADVFAVQEEITREISEKLRIRLTGALSQQLAKRPTQNLKAFQYYMQGRANADRRTRDSLQAALRFYEKAIEEDHNYALAYAGLAEAYAQLGIRGYILASEGRQKSEAAARTALGLDENLAEAHVANALFHVVLPPHDFSLGDRELRRAIELSPSLAMAHFYLGVSLVRQGRLDEALQKNLKARELDPLSPIIARQMTIYYFFKRDYPRALEHIRYANELGPPFSVSWEVGVYVQNHLFEDALAELEKVKHERKDDPVVIYSMGAVFAARAQRTEALQIVKELEEASGPTLQQAHNIAKIYAALNEKEMTISWLERGLEAGAIGALYRDEPVWDPVRADPRFGELLRRMRIPE
jgi:TolB-like protein/Tfp pilus assembly protein PilF